MASYRCSRYSWSGRTIGTDMATEPQHRDLSSPREMRVNPHVGTIVEPGPSRIDMTKFDNVVDGSAIDGRTGNFLFAVSYTHLRAHETPEHLVCRLLLEKKKTIHRNYP